MRRSDFPTGRHRPPPTVLVIGASKTLVERCREAAIFAQALTAECEATDAASAAALYRPLAMVMLEEVYRADPPSWNALGADIRSRIVLLPGESIGTDELRDLLLGAIAEAEAARDSSPSSYPVF